MGTLQFGAFTYLDFSLPLVGYCYSPSNPNSESPFRVKCFTPYSYCYSPVLTTTNSTYFLKQHQICRSTSATYLGVTIDEHLKWTNHIQHVTCKANSANAFLRRNISSCTQQTKKLCYLAMVRPLLEYASTVWSPYTNSSIYKLEMVQRRAARFITNNYSPWDSVTEILDHLNLPTLEQRRNNLKLVMMYKMVHRQVHIDNGTYLIPTASQTRGHDQRFLQPHSIFFILF